MYKTGNILICPLEWGLGHAARMIPLARKLRERNCNVFIGAGEKHLALFRAEMTDVTFIDFPGFSPGYSRVMPQYLSMLFKTPLLLYHIIREHKRLRRLIREYKIDIIISDNRFGLWNNDIISVYVTHMPRIPLPFPWKALERIGVSLHRWIIKRYDYCMIPDLPGDLNLSGKLSHDLKLPENVRYTGIISRFGIIGKVTEKSGYRHNTIVLSGPEPQRSILREKLLDVFRNKQVTTVILEGKPENITLERKKGNLVFYSHLAAAEMGEVLRTSDCIISRSGYTTIMDLVFLDCTGLLIPTPGQTEQEYLAEYLSGRGFFSTINQDEINMDISLPDGKSSWQSDLVEKSKILLDNFLAELLEEIQEESDKYKSG